jgi:hypothetical protein
VRCLAGILLLLTFASTGSGALARLHDLAHARQDHHGHGHDDGDHEHVPAPAQPVHDETNCELHAMLRAPLMAGTTVPVLILLGLFAAFLTQLAPRLHSQRVPARIDCRGPPVL